MHTYMTVSEYRFIHLIISIYLHQTIVSPNQEVQNTISCDVIIVQTQDAAITLIVSQFPSMGWRIPERYTKSLACLTNGCSTFTFIIKEPYIQLYINLLRWYAVQWPDINRTIFLRYQYKYLPKIVAGKMNSSSPAMLDRKGNFQIDLDTDTVQCTHRIVQIK